MHIMQNKFNYTDALHWLHCTNVFVAHRYSTIFSKNFWYFLQEYPNNLQTIIYIYMNNKQVFCNEKAQKFKGICIVHNMNVLCIYAGSNATHFYNNQKQQ